MSGISIDFQANDGANVQEDMAATYRGADDFFSIEPDPLPNDPRVDPLVALRYE